MHKFKEISMRKRLDISRKRNCKRGILYSILMVGLVFNVFGLNVEASAKRLVELGEKENQYGLMSSDLGYEGSIQRTNGTQGFTTGWQTTTYGDDRGDGYGTRAKMTYGFNTFAINEDFTWADHSLKKHSAIVQNNKGTFMSAKKAAGTTAKIEVTHSGNVIIYQNTWYK